MLKPFYNKKKNIDNRLVPPVTAVDVGKVLGVDDEGKYALTEGGGKLYAHKIRSSDANFPISVIIVNGESTEFTNDTLKQYLKDKEFGSLTPLSGTVNIRSDGTNLLFSTGIYYAMSGTTINLVVKQPYIKISDSSVGTKTPTITQSIYDVVVEL